jgi:16S rRNA pseudouridine516 synthase
MKLLRMIANLGYGSRKEARGLLREGRVTDTLGRVLSVDDVRDHHQVRIDGEPLDPAQGMVVMLHKPVGVTCSHNDVGELVFDLLPERFSRRRPALSCVGRLDRDTSGLLLLTDDGPLLHRVISPRSHLTRIYRTVLAEDLRGDEAERFASGQLMLKSETRPLAPAGLEVLDARTARVRLDEGRYHQVRRMFAACGNRVLGLHREALGDLTLGDLEPGAWRVLDAAEIAALFSASPPRA